MRPKHARGRIVDPTPPTASPVKTYAMPDYARTAAEWWQIVDHIWPSILSIAERVGFDAVAVASMEKMRTDRDKALHERLDAIWFAAPDECFIHNWSNWGAFCDLCSEAAVLYEGENNA